MVLHRVFVCVNPEMGHIQGITFLLRTIASEYVTYSELKTIGNVDSPNCKPYIIPDRDIVEYVEITYTDYIDTFVMHFDNDYYSFWGNKRRDVEYETKRWEFNSDW